MSTKRRWAAPGRLASLVLLAFVSLLACQRGVSTQQTPPGQSVGPTQPAQQSDLAVLYKDGRLGLARSSDGGVQKVALSGIKGRNLVGGSTVRFNSDRTEIYFDQAPGVKPCESEILKVSTEGGTSQRVAGGFAPAFSPNDQFLAYMTGEADCDPSLVVRDVQSGTERKWSFSGKGVEITPCELAWLPDSSRLALDFCGEESSELRVLDTVNHRTLADAVRLGPDWSGGRLAIWLLMDVQPSTGLILAVEGCCRPGFDDVKQKLITIDPVTGNTVATLAEFPELARFEAADLNGSGDELLYVDGLWRLLRWKNGQTVKVGEGFLSASW